MTVRLLVLAVTLALAGCDLAALLADPKVAQREADAKAIGSACRHGQRSLEDCFAMNEKASKAAVFAGWKEMDQYMRDNKIEGIETKGDSKPAAAPESKEAASEAKTESSAEAKGDAKEPKAKPKTKSKADKAPA